MASQSFWIVLGIMVHAFFDDTIVTPSNACLNPCDTIVRAGFASLRRNANEDRVRTLFVHNDLRLDPRPWILLQWVFARCPRLLLAGFAHRLSEWSWRNTQKASSGDKHFSRITAAWDRLLEELMYYKIQEGDEVEASILKALERKFAGICTDTFMSWIMEAVPSTFSVLCLFSPAVLQRNGIDKSFSASFAGYFRPRVLETVRLAIQKVGYLSAKLSKDEVFRIVSFDFFLCGENPKCLPHNATGIAVGKTQIKCLLFGCGVCHSFFQMAFSMEPLQEPLELATVYSLPNMGPMKGLRIGSLDPPFNPLEGECLRAYSPTSSEDDYPENTEDEFLTSLPSYPCYPIEPLFEV